MIGKEIYRVPKHKALAAQMAHTKNVFMVKLKVCNAYQQQKWTLVANILHNQQHIKYSSQRRIKKNPTTISSVI